MQSLLKTLSLILFLLISFNFNLSADKGLKNANLVILDKSSSTKYYLSLSKNSTFRSLQFEIFSCQLLSFEKYDDQVALIKISNSIDSFYLLVGSTSIQYLLPGLCFECSIYLLTLFRL